MRKCLASNELYPKKELLRIVKTPSGQVVVDLTGKQNGRGAYLKLNQENIEVLKKNHSLKRALDCDIPASIYKELEELLK